MSNIRMWFNAKSETNKIIRHINAELGPCRHKNLKDIAITIRSMDIEILNVDPNPCDYQTGKKR